jgi:hypothetical protein
MHRPHGCGGYADCYGKILSLGILSIFYILLKSDIFLHKYRYFSWQGMVKSHRIRFTSLMGVVDAPTAAENIITSLRRRAAIVFIPEIFYYVVNLVRVLPAKVILREESSLSFRQGRYEISYRLNFIGKLFF